MDSTQPLPPPASAAQINSAATIPSAHTPSASAPNTGDHAAIRLPIVRLLQSRTGRTRLVAIYDDHLVVGVCRRTYAISEPMLKAEGEAELERTVTQDSAHELRRCFCDQKFIPAPYSTLSRCRRGLACAFNFPCRRRRRDT